MTATTILQTIRSMFKHTWKSHQVTLSLIILAVFECRRLSISTIGRSLRCDTVPKHAIKRVDRFLGNRKFDDKQTREQFLQFIVGFRRHIVIAVDWTKLRRWPVLVAGVVRRGRAIPVLWAVADPKKLYKSQNAFEHGFLAWLRATLPADVEATLLFDRGFKRVDIIPHLKGFNFVIRTGGNVHIHSGQFRGRMDELIHRRGMQRDLPDATLRPSRPVHVRVVGVWERGCKEPWLLMTNLRTPLREVVALYAKRFRIEESFRDQKDWRYGLQAGHTLVTKAERLERMLLIAALVTLFAILVGSAARREKLDRGFRANTTKDRATHSDFTLGMYYALQRQWTRSKLFRNFQFVLEQ